MSKPDRLKPFPRYDTDAEAERFVAESDLSDYDLSGFETARVVFAGGAATLDVQLPLSLFTSIEDRAKHRGISPERYIRELIERDVSEAETFQRR